MKFKQIRVNYGDHSKLVMVRDDHKEKPTFTQEPCIRHCCRQDENGELVDKDEESETDVTLAVVSNGKVHCMECGNSLLNARLIASAPEMHALLARIASDDLGDVQTAVELAMDAREILAKVEGEK